MLNRLRDWGILPATKPSGTLLGGPHVFFGPSVWDWWRLDPAESMNLLAANGLAFKFEVFGDNPDRYQLPTAVARCKLFCEAARKRGVYGCLTLNNGNDKYFDKKVGLAYFRPGIDEIFEFIDPALVMVEAVSESDGSPTQSDLEKYSVDQWHARRKGVTVWNRRSRPQGLPAGYDVLDYHIFKLEDRYAAPRLPRVIISADTTPMIHWLSGKADYRGPYIPARVGQMVSACRVDGRWGIDLYPAGFQSLDKASIKEAGKR
jgi:hypothetical protein